MSGGHFDYKQCHLRYLADDVDVAIEQHIHEYSQETIDKFKETAALLRKAYVYVQRMDWLLSGDDGEETYHKRLKEELKKLEVSNDNELE